MTRTRSNPNEDAVARLRRELAEHLRTATPAEIDRTLDAIGDALRPRAGERGVLVAVALEGVRDALRRADASRRRDGR
jgi:hypothetical protein